jgi:hypothetical protein
MPKHIPKSKINRYVQDIATWPLDARRELFEELRERGLVPEPETFLLHYDTPELDIDNRFGPVECVILRVLKHDRHASMAEDDLLRRVWPQEAPRVLDEGTVEERRALRLRLLKRYESINAKLAEFDEPWRVVRVRETTENPRYYFAEHGQE